MTALSWGLLALFLGVLFVASWLLGSWVTRLFSGNLPRWMLRVEAPLYRLAGTSAEKSMHWSEVRTGFAGIQCDRFFRGLCHAAAPGLAPSEPCWHGGRVARFVLQHRYQLCDQHQLAGLRWRIDHGLLVANGGFGSAEFFVRRHRHCRYSHFFAALLPALPA